jgi:hypothetical protein
LQPRTRWNAAELLGYAFPEQRWAVPGILAEGLNVLVGPPKVGKSWLGLNIAVAIASGGVALGRIRVVEGDVLYLALEDTPRRLQDRLGKVLTGSPAPTRLDIETRCASLDRGGFDLIHSWLCEHPDARAVIVDVWARVRGFSDPRTNAYESDYAAASKLKALADEFGVTLVCVHHTRKSGADDYVDTVSGSQGIAGCADAILVLSRSRGGADAVMKVTGRDIEETEFALQFAPDIGAWQMLDGPAGDYDLGDTRRRIVHHVRDHGPATPKHIADALDMKEPTVRQTVRRMAEDGQLDTDGNGSYFEPMSPVTHVTPVTQPHRDSDTSDSSDTPRFNGEHERARQRAYEEYE